MEKKQRINMTDDAVLTGSRHILNFGNGWQSFHARPLFFPEASMQDFNRSYELYLRKPMMTAIDKHKTVYGYLLTRKTHHGC